MKRPSLKDLPPDFPGRLKALRERAGLRAEELATLIGYSRSGMFKLESPDGRPTWDAVCKLADALNVSTEVFRPAKPKPVAA